MARFGSTRPFPEGVKLPRLGESLTTRRSLELGRLTYFVELQGQGLSGGLAPRRTTMNVDQYARRSSGVMTSSLVVYIGKAGPVGCPACQRSAYGQRWSPEMGVTIGLGHGAPLGFGVTVWHGAQSALRSPGS